MACRACALLYPGWQSSLRIMCEGAILLFSLHELLVSIDTRAGVLVRQDKRSEP
jgi:hypothetical protein